jgi:hypothetical protein
MIRTDTTLPVLKVVAALIFAAVAAPGQNFGGRVVEDSSGEAVASAELKLHKTGMRELYADLDTDRTGHFEGVDISPGDYTVDVLKANFLTTTFPIHIPNNGVQVRLLRYGVMDGHVTNIRGEAVAGIVRAPYGQTIGATRLTVLAKQPGSEEFRSIRDRPLEDGGHFRFFDLPPGQYELGMWYYGINEGSGMQLYPDNANPRVFTIAGGEVYKDLNFLIAPNPEFKVSGTVELPASKLEFTLALGLPDQPTLPIAIALAKDDGSFQFDKVPPGSYDLFAAGPTGGYTQFESVMNDKKDALFGRMRIQVAGSDLTSLSVPVKPARSLDVVLRAHGGGAFPAACPQSATVNLSSMDPWGVLFRASSPVSAAKEQTVRNLPPGRLSILASGLGSGCFQSNEVVVDLSKETPQPLAIEVAAAGSIQGTLLTGATHATSYAVMLIDATAGAPSQLAFPDTAGHFVFETLHPGRYRIAAQPAAEASRTRWLTNLSQMKEVNVAGGQNTSVELAVPANTGGAQ